MFAEVAEAAGVAEVRGEAGGQAVRLAGVVCCCLLLLLLHSSSLY